MKKKLPRLIPLLILVGISIYSLFEFISGAYFAGWRHYVAFILLGINLVVYFYKIRPAVLMTGVILLLGTFNLLSFFVETTTYWLGMGDVKLPEIQLSMLGLLILYGFLNFHFLWNWYLDRKYGPVK